MPTEMNRLMIEIAVSRAIRQICSGDTHRGLRQLVDFGSRYAAGALTVTVCDLLSGMLRSASHPYYETFRRFCSQSDWRYINGYGITMGYDSWSPGAARTRRMSGGDPLWYTLVDLDHPEEDPLPLLDSACGRGIRSFLLLTHRPEAETLCLLCSRYPRCAVTLITDDEVITDSLLDSLQSQDNLAIAAVRGSGDFRARDRLENHRRVCFLCRRITGEEAREAVALRSLPEENGVFICYLPEEGMDAEVLAAFDDLVCRTRLHPKHPFLPLILPQDLRRVQEMIDRETGLISAGKQVLGKLARKVMEQL